MKYLIAVVLLLAVIGLGWYFFGIQHPNTAPVGENSPPVATSSPTVSTTTPGMSYSYPDPLPTTFVSSAEWPPKVEQLEDYSCSPADNGPTGKVESRVIGGKTYCVTTEGEGAAGSTYVTYGYTTDRGDAVLRTSFVLRFPQCLNYDDPQQSACKSEQASFNVDTLATNILASVKLK